MAKHYAVTITASQTAVDAQTLSKRLAELLDEPSERVEAAVCGGTVIVQRKLSYGEAIEFQRELNRRRIPAQVSVERELQGVELLLRPLRAREEEAVMEASAQDILEMEPESWESEAEKEAEEEAEEEAAVEEENAWAELFPELAEEKQNAKKKNGQAAQARVPVATKPVPAKPVAAKTAKIKEPAAAEDAKRAQRFDSEKLTDAFVDAEERRPPFKPKGFDKRPEHVPLVAALLSVLAPGAGQVFNGQPEKAQSLSVSFLLVYPWVRAVRQAFRYAEKVRTYYAPRPAEGAFKRALIYAAKWWAAVLLVGWVLSWAAGSVLEYRDNLHEQKVRANVQQLVFFGQDVVADGLEEAREAATAAAAEIEEKSPRMSDEERARRLFIIGYHHCKAREYQLCEATMRRVSVLSRENRDAFRLQTWAAIQVQAEDRSFEMPEVGAVPTLEEFELELSLEGENIHRLRRDQSWWDEGKD